MSAPFQPGDVVVCVDARKPGWPNPPAPWLVRGQLYRVTDTGGDTLRPGIRVAGVTMAWEHDWFRAARFRRIDDEVTEEFREQLRSLNTPVKRGVGV